MRGWLPCLVCVCACGGGERIAECEAMLATVDRIAACGRLDTTQRAQIEHAVRSIKEALDRLEDVGPGRVPGNLLDEAKRTCVKEDEEIRQLYEKVAPDCLR